MMSSPSHISAALIIPLLFLVYMCNAQTPCTRVDDQSNTCYIDRHTKWKSSDGNITCDASYSNCVITCEDDKYACGSAEETSVPFIVFSATNQCVLNCDANEGCYGSVVHSMSCSAFTLNVNGMAQNNMHIYAPDHGALSIATLNEQTSFSYNAIYSGTWTSSIFIDCEMALKCTKNDIYAQWVTTQLHYACNSYCDSTNIYCPREANCDVRCQHSCNSLFVDSPDRIQRLSLVCDDTYCADTSVACTVNGTQMHSYFVISTSSAAGSMQGPCTVDEFEVLSMPSPSLSSSLALLIYYNDSVVVTPATDDAVLRGFADILTQAVLDTYNSIRGEEDGDGVYALNVLLCSVFNRGLRNDCNSSVVITPSNRQYRAQYMASVLIELECIDCESNSEFEHYTNYVRSTMGTERFLAYFDAEMNLKLFAIEEFTTIALRVDATTVVLSVNDRDDLLSEQMNKSRQSQLVMIVIAIAMFSFIVCSFLCGYYIVHFSAKKMARISMAKTSGGGHRDDVVGIRKEPWNERLRSPKRSVLSKSSMTSDQSAYDDGRVHSRSLHWGFTNEHEKHGESGYHKVVSPGASSARSSNADMESAAQLAYHMAQNNVHQLQCRAHRLSVKQRIDQHSIPEDQEATVAAHSMPLANVCDAETDDEEKVCLKGDTDAETDGTMSSSCRYHTRSPCPTFKLLPAQIPHQPRCSESSMDVEELFREQEGDQTSTLTKPQHHQQTSLAVNVAITSPNSLTSVEKLDDDLDDYDFNDCIPPEFNLNHGADADAEQVENTNTLSSLFATRRSTRMSTATSITTQSDLSSLEEESSETSETSQPKVQKRTTKQMAVSRAVNMNLKQNRRKVHMRNRTMTTEPELPLSPSTSTRYLSSPQTTLVSLASPSMVPAANAAQMLQIPNRLQTQLPKMATSSSTSSASSSLTATTANDLSSQYDDEKVCETNAPRHSNQTTDFSISQKIPSIYWDG